MCKNYNSNKRSLVTTLVVLAICAVIVTGSTFSLFTSKTGTNIAITAGNVKMTATIDEALTLYSKDVKQTTGKFENGGTAGLNDKKTELTVTNITPGDKVELKINLKNESNVDVAYRVTWSVEGKLAEVLTGTVDGNPFTAGTSEWTKWAIPTNEDAKTKTITLAVAFPMDIKKIDGKEINYNDYQGKTANITFAVEAVQANATGEWKKDAYVNTAEGLQAAVNSGATEIILNEDVVLTKSIEIPAPKATATTYSLRNAATPIVIDLNGNEITGDIHKSVGAIVKNNGYVVIKNGTISSLANNGGSALANSGVAVLQNVTLNGAPNADGSWPSYTVNNTGDLTATNTKFTSYHGAVASYGDGAIVTLNNCEIDMKGIPGFTSHGIYTYDNGVVVVNGGTYVNHAADQAASGASVINGAVTVNGGTFSGRIENYYGTPVIAGGTFSVNPNAKFLAAGYKTIDNKDGTYTVLFPQESFDALLENAVAGETVQIPAGNYTFPASLKEGMTLNCAPGTVFTGSTGLNANGATIVGATFSNPTGTAGTSTVNGTFKNCTFDGANGLRWCYAGDVVVFENCVFTGDTYGVHFDGGAKEVKFIDCTLSGFNAIAGDVKLTMKGCTFQANGRSNYNGINIWGSATLTDCTFVFDGEAGYEWVDACGDNKTLNFTNCVVTDGENTKGIETVVGNYGVGNTIIINGEISGLVSDEVALDADLASGKDVVLTGNLSFSSSATTANSGYGATGVSVQGSTLDGNGHSLGINNWGTWDSAVHTTGGTIKNLAINSGMRGIFMGSATENVYIDHVVIDGTIYTFNSDGGSKEYGVYISNSTLNGWTSFSNVHKEVVFTNCNFGEGEGYAFCRPYMATTFTNCVFEKGFVIDISVIGGHVFDNCYYGDVLITAENAANLGLFSGDLSNITVK